MTFKKALIIDDDGIDTYLTKRVITENSFAEEILTASSVSEAMVLLSSFSPETFPEIIFLDLNLPGQNGLDFLEQFSKMNVSLKSTVTIVLLMNVTNSADSLSISAKTHPLVKYVMEKPLTSGKLKSISR